MARPDNTKNFPFRVSIAEALRKRAVLSLIAGLFIFGFSSTAALSQTKKPEAFAATVSWIGKYEFEDFGKRRNRDELVPSINYLLEISKDKRTGKISCSFNATGYQSNEEHQCSVKAADGSLSVYFEKDLIHTSDEEKEFVQFKNGQLLFNLVKSQAGNKTHYLFRPAAYKIYLFGVGKKAKRAVYFTQSK